MYFCSLKRQDYAVVLYRTASSLNTFKGKKTSLKKLVMTIVTPRRNCCYLYYNINSNMPASEKSDKNTFHIIHIITENRAIEGLIDNFRSVFVSRLIVMLENSFKNQ